MRAGQLGQASRGAGDGRIEPDGMRSAGSRSDNSSIIRRLGKIWLFFASILPGTMALTVGQAAGAIVRINAPRMLPGPVHAR